MLSRRASSHALASLFQPPVYFGVSIIALVWFGAITHIEVERQAGRQAIVNETANLSHVFEENIVRSIGEVDKALLFLRRTYERSAGTASWTRLIAEAGNVSDTTFQIAIIDENGILIATTVEVQPGRIINLSDREHFRVHANDASDFLFISKPVLGRASGKWSVQLTRKFLKADGNFGGVIVASLDPMLLSRPYESIKLGTGGAIVLAGLDGIVRAAGGHGAPKLSDDLSKTELFRHIATDTKGSFERFDRQTGVTRIHSFRVVKNFPLVVVVSAASEESDPSYQRNRRTYLGTASGLTILAMIAIAVGLRQSRRIEQARQAYARSEARASKKSRELELTLDHMSQGIIMVDAAGQVAVINRQAIRLLGLPKSFLRKHPAYRELIEFQRRSGEFDNSDSGLSPHVLEYIDNPADAAPVPLYQRTRPNGTVLEVRSEVLPDGGFVRTFSDVTRRSQTEARISHLARHDSLTNLANRILFNERLEHALTSSAGRERIALLCIDLDLFKAVNDGLGHPIGDKLLQAVAGRLQQIARTNDLVARLGGDEFAVVQQAAEKEDAARLADRIMERLSEPFSVEGHSVIIGASVGIALAPEDAETLEGLLKAADLALYEAKAAGRSTRRFYEPQMNAKAQARRSLECDLREALPGNQFELFYQPVYMLGSREITGFEALLRWRHPRRGLVQPADFITIAEDNGLIVPIGAWVLRQACAELASLPEHLKMAVNLSPVQFRCKDLVLHVREALAGANIAAHRLELEITESTLLQRDQLTHQLLCELRDLGVRIAMDDFGTGYSSLSYLMRFPFDTLKIDRTFVSELGKRTGSAAIIRAVTNLAASLGMTTTAEGVETREQLEALRSLGCLEAQGYWWSPPRPASEIRALFSPRADPAPAPAAA